MHKITISLTQSAKQCLLHTKMKSLSYLSYFTYNYYYYYDDYNSGDHHNYFYGQCFYRYLITLSLLLVIYAVNSVTCQTNEIEIDNCFGLTNNDDNNNKHDFKKLLKSFAYRRAYYYKTKPDGLELVTKFNPLSCIYGVILPHEKSFHHLNIHIMDTYLQVIKSTSDKYELISKHQVKFSILQNIDDGITDSTVYLAKIYMQLNENNKTNMLLQISEFKSLVSPVYFIIEHDLPTEVDGLIHVHLHLLVTPVYLCRKYEGMLLPVDKDFSRYQGEQQQQQQLPIEKDKTTIGELFNCMEAKNKSLLGNLFKPYFCIKSSLMCDQYSNCPQVFSYTGHNFKTLDEHPVYCRKVFVFRMKDITLQTIFFSLLSISLILMTLTFALRKRFLNLFDRMCNRRQTTQLTTNESDNVGNITETGDGHQQQYHRPITIIVNNADIMRNNTLSVLYNQNVSPTHFYEPPPSYNEAIKHSNMLSKQQRLDDSSHSHADSPVDMTTSAESCSDICQLPRKLKTNSLSRKIFSPYYPEETSGTTSSVCLKRSKTSPPNYIHCFMSDLMSEASNLYSSNKNEDEGNER